MNAIVPIATPAVPALSMGEIEHIATTIARGGLFGSKDPYAVATLCMLAYAEGQHPVSVFRDYHVISGKPSKKAEAMQRDFQLAGGTIEWHQLDDDCADATFSHPAGGSARITWDKARVKQAQLGSNAMHSKYPRQMLRARVVSEGVRTVFPGATSGLYVPDEVAAFDEAPKAARSTPTAPQAQRARDLTPERPALPPVDDARQKAEAWVAEHIEAIDAAATTEDLDTVVGSGRKALDKLRRDHADLAERVSSAIATRVSALSGAGPADEQRGERHTDADMITDDLIAQAEAAQ